jgi:threonine dehydratase
VDAPTFADVLDARTRIAPHLLRTPLREYPPLGRLIDATVFVKHENHLPTGAFKVRGGINLVSQLSQGERERGVVASSTGNHGQSIAFGARLYGVKATICVPENANPVKVAAMRDLGAEVSFRTESTSTRRASSPSSSRSSTGSATSIRGTSRC